MRFYPIPDPHGGLDLVVPGVTSLLSHDMPPEEKQRLAEWRAREIAAGRDPNAGRDRGTAVHALLEAYIRTGEIPSTGEVSDYASGMEQYLDAYDSFLWSERPLVDGWEHVWSHAGADVGEEGAAGEDKPIARVWSARWGYAGTPDLIGKHRKRGLTLGDFKTSNCPYYRPSGSRVPAYAKLGYQKYKKTVRQLCAYRLAIRETLDLEVDEIVIYVGLRKRGESQQFWVERREIEQETEALMRTASLFWSRPWLPSGCLPPEGRPCPAAETAPDPQPHPLSAAA